MRLKIYNPTTCREETIYLYLRETAANEIALATCEKDGTPIDCGMLLTISKSGITRHFSVNKELGFPLSSGKRVQTT